MNMEIVQNNTQEYTSANTSIATLNRIYKILPDMGYDENSIILDYGCGKYDKNKNYATENKFTWVGYDPYNREEEENNDTIQFIKTEKPDIIVCSNVLNVIKEDNAMINVLNQIYNYASGDTDVYITIYEGNKSGVGAETSKGYQRNSKLDKYKDYIYEWFDIIDIIKPNIVKCKKIA